MFDLSIELIIYGIRIAFTFRNQMNKQEKLDIIFKEIMIPKNVWNENVWDFWEEDIYLGDVLWRMFENWVEISWWSNDKLREIVDLWLELRESIKNQPEECIDSVLKLIQIRRCDI